MQPFLVDKGPNHSMAAILSTPKCRELKRVVEILVIAVALIIVFSVSGMPMILLSTFSPSSIYWNREQDHSDKLTIDGSAEAA
jgi:Na+(H+)/acetate symporter ActP